MYNDDLLYIYSSTALPMIYYDTRIMVICCLVYERRASLRLISVVLATNYFDSGTVLIVYSSSVATVYICFTIHNTRTVQFSGKYRTVVTVQ
jgi:hypothetical protein